MGKIMKTQFNIAPWEDMNGTVYQEKRTTMWDSFLECIMGQLFHLFRHDSGEALKYYITNTLKKPMRVPIRYFFIKVEQLNSYLGTLHCI